MNHVIGKGRLTPGMRRGLPARFALRCATSTAGAGPLAPRLIAILCASAFVLRASLLAHLVSGSAAQYFSLITIGSLLIAAAYVFVDRVGRIDKWGLLLILATGASLWHCERFDFALSRWIGWAILLLVLGPVRSTWRARQFRHHMSETLYAIFAAAVVLSALWRLAELPNLGRGIFCGVMGHSMILGPIAGLVAIRALARVDERGSTLACALYLVALVVCALASSRAALAALAAGSFVIVLMRCKKHPLIASLAVAAMSAFVVAPTGTLAVLGSVLPSGLTAGIQEKSWDNSRELHWQARWDEFMSSPITGVGFASAWTDTVGVDELTGTVETGSSYLAVLSMTGLAGGTACVLFVAALGCRVGASRRRLTRRQLLEFCGLGAFWAVHLGAEGYIYAVSSLPGLTFWLWLGCLTDQLSEPRRVAAKLRLAPATTPLPTVHRASLAAAHARLSKQR
jgi:O-antigen ligase